MFRRVMGQTNFALRQGLISIIQLYQYLISPLLGSRCRSIRVVRNMPSMRLAITMF